MTPPDEPNLGTILYRLDAHDRALRELSTHVDDRLDKLEGSVQQLAFVRSDLYASEKAASQDYAKETRDIAIAARTVSMWALGIIVVATLGALITGIVRVLAA